MFHVQRPGEDKPRDIPVHYKIKPGSYTERQSLRTVGIQGGGAVRVFKTIENSLGALAGLKEKDMIETLNGEPIYSPSAIQAFVDEHPGAPVTLSVKHAKPGGKKDEKVEYEPTAVPTPVKPAEARRSRAGPWESVYGTYVG